jgi:hypothetical protein
MMNYPLTPTFLENLRKNGIFAGKALRLVEAQTLAHLSVEIDRLRGLVLQLIPDNWNEDADAKAALAHLAQHEVPMALALIADQNAASQTRSSSVKEFPVEDPARYQLKDRALGVLDRHIPKTSQQIAVELGSPDRVDLLAALGQLCAEGMAIREPGTGVYLARTSPCA